MHYVYLLRSESYPKQPYVGLTRDLRKRLIDTIAGDRRIRPSSVHGRLARIAFSNEKAAIAFEKYLKSGSGRAFAKHHFF
ncbi:MAG TPA: GIY-YIG nuclease family protein [Candidatus Udaeobacter sp.]